MALTKLPKNAIADDAVDASKIEDGTIQNQELAGSLSEDKLATGTIENASLSNSTITINGNSISLGGSSSVGVEVNWQSVITADGSTTTTGVAGNGYFIDTTSEAHTFNLPASATLGDQIAIKDYAGTFGSNNLTIGRNGHNIQGNNNDSVISTNRASVLLVYIDSTKGWIYAEESNVGDLQNATFITATGGTVTESGDFKIHTFTGDGCFVVSQVGNMIGGPSIVDYLVIAGGAGGASGGSNSIAGGAGGGGAGGFRESHSTPISGSYTASPLATPTGITLSVTTYPITVGAGGAARTSPSQGGNPGSNSVFSTITSSGGGGGGAGYNGIAYGSAASGGSGGGAGGSYNVLGTGTGGSGNTPPTSPPQGNAGGTISGCNVRFGAGGGGAGAAVPTNTINGGNGVTTSITGSPVTRSGGGAGGSGNTAGGTGGSGGGGNGGGNTAAATSGSTNTGSGGGGSGDGDSVGGNTSGAGGKGIVIIRYKFQ
jgi:hypothetical protein